MLIFSSCKHNDGSQSQNNTAKLNNGVQLVFTKSRKNAEGSILRSEINGWSNADHIEVSWYLRTRKKTPVQLRKEIVDRPKKQPVFYIEVPNNDSGEVVVGVVKAYKNGTQYNSQKIYNLKYEEQYINERKRLRSISKEH